VGDRQKFGVKGKYRGATKRWHRGAIINIVVQQKMGIAVDSEIS
jgi:hypothetical protein